MVSYCPTKQIVAKYNCKPLQGKQNYELHDIIMGTSATLLEKECAEKYGNHDIKKVIRMRILRHEHNHADTILEPQP